VLLGVDDMDVFKGIELKLQAYERLLEDHPEWRGKVVLVQVRAGGGGGREGLKVVEALRVRGGGMKVNMGRGEGRG
jgi:trehalose 6-phosphate synthase/phosphatase